MQSAEWVAWQAIAVGLTFAIFVALLLPFVSSLVGPRKPNEDKLQAYECGITPFEEANGPVSVRFSVIAMLFLLFDIELVFLYPWAASFGQLGVFALVEALIFLSILGLGYWWVWKRGAFVWDK